LPAIKVLKITIFLYLKKAYTYVKKAKNARVKAVLVLYYVSRKQAAAVRLKAVRSFALKAQRARVPAFAV
jgi:hypothetical protein